MAYFLGIKQYGKLKPLVLTLENGDNIPNKLLDILLFTTSFDSETDLKEYLLKQHSIDNFSGELCYLIGKGNKNNRYYEVIQLGDHIYLSEGSKFLKLEYIKQYIKEHKYSVGFMDHLYSYYIKKYGLLNMAVQRFMSKAYDYNQISEWIERLLAKNFSETFKNHLRTIMDFISDPKIGVKNGYLYVTREEDMAYQELLTSINYILSSDDGDVRKFFYFFKGICKYPDIPVIRHLEKMCGLSNYVNSTNSLMIDHFEEQEDIGTYIDKFLASLLYTYDYMTRDYKKVNGSYKINERNLCDLAMFLSTYDDYENNYDYQVLSPSYEEKNHTPQNDTEEYDKEEFLEPDDFDDPLDIEEHGYNLHYGDGTKKW